MAGQTGRSGRHEWRGRNEPRYVALFGAEWDSGCMAICETDGYDIEAALMVVLVDEWQSPMKLSELVRGAFSHWFCWGSFFECED